MSLPVYLRKRYDTFQRHVLFRYEERSALLTIVESLSTILSITALLVLSRGMRDVAMASLCKLSY